MKHPLVAKEMSQFILEKLSEHKQSSECSPAKLRPLFVGVQGPQGSGKTFSTSWTKTILSEAPHSLSVAVISIDDFYLPYHGLKALAGDHPDNPLLQGRGQPGTHDISLAISILNSLRGINDQAESETKPVELPVFDKSQYSGFGDRLPPGSGPLIFAPVDVVILEGWFIGFLPTSEEIIVQKWEQFQVVPDLQDLPGEAFDMRKYSVKNILEINGNLRCYVECWSLLDAFIQIRPPETSPYKYIYTWRLEQEHAMKAKNGGKGMTDEEVRRFIDRYIPGYVFFSPVSHPSSATSESQDATLCYQASGRRIAITIGRDREILATSVF